MVATDWTGIVTPRRRLTQKVVEQISEAAGVSLSEWNLAGMGAARKRGFLHLAAGAAMRCEAAPLSCHELPPEADDGNLQFQASSCQFLECVRSPALIPLKAHLSLMA